MEGKTYCPKCETEMTTAVVLVRALKPEEGNVGGHVHCMKCPKCGYHCLPKEPDAEEPTT